MEQEGDGYLLLDSICIGILEYYTVILNDYILQCFQIGVQIVICGCVGMSFVWLFSLLQNCAVP